MIYSIESYKQENEVQLINNFIDSKDRRNLLELKKYAKGFNPFIEDRKKYVFDSETGCNIENVFTPNFKSKYGFYNQVISQKVNALTSEAPIIEGVPDNIRKSMGFATKKASYIASMQGYSFTFVGINNQFIVFETENTLAYADDLGNLKVVLRFWQSTIDNKTITYYERYNADGVIRFKYGSGINGVEQVTGLIPYKVKVYSSELSTEIEAENIEVLPIIVCKNNENLEPDLTPALKSKIDLLDLIESDLYNNIEEFSDVWLSVSANVDAETARKIKDNIRRTKTLVADDGVLDIKTIQIPYEARQVAINNLKQELVEDGGIIDFKEIKGNATATEINARTYRLTQKVSDFEWYIDDYLTNVVKVWQLYNNKSFEISITFQKLFIKNNLELVNIANSVYGKISQKAYLRLLQQAQIIEDVDAEIKEQEEESISKFSFDDGGLDGQGTQSNGQDFETNEQEE